jgi:hypothetical protein
MPQKAKAKKDILREISHPGKEKAGRNTAALITSKTHAVFIGLHPKQEPILQMQWNPVNPGHKWLLHKPLITPLTAALHHPRA